jgi:hypothetical protein
LVRHAITVEMLRLVADRHESFASWPEGPRNHPFWAAVGG